MHTALGTAAAIWGLCHPNSEKAIEEAAKQKALAIRGIREKLRQNVNSNAIVGAIANLASMEVCEYSMALYFSKLTIIQGIVGDFDVALVHLKGVQNLVASRGGFDAFRDDEDVCRAINW